MGDKKRTAEQKVAVAKINVMTKYWLLANVLGLCRVTVCDTSPSASVDGQLNVRMGRAFVDKLTQQETTYLLLHELAHVAWGDALKPPPPSLVKDILNMAMDHHHNLWLNRYISESGYEAFATMPEGVCADPKYDGAQWNVPAIYDDIRKCANIIQISMDDHSGHGDKGGDTKDGNGQVRASMSDVEIRSAVAAAVAAGADRQAQEDERKGRVPGSGTLQLGQILDSILKPPSKLIDALTNFASVLAAGTQDNNASAWCPVALMHGRFEWEYFDEVVPPLCIAVDVSGSMSDADVSYVYGTIAMLNKISEIHHVQWDGDIVHESMLTQIDLPINAPRMIRHGCGGTDANVAIERINQLARGQGVVAGLIITDGLVPDIEVKCDVPLLWLITDTVPKGISKRDVFRVGSN